MTALESMVTAETSTAARSPTTARTGTPGPPAPAPTAGRAPAPKVAATRASSRTAEPQWPGGRVVVVAPACLVAGDSVVGVDAGELPGETGFVVAAEAVASVVVVAWPAVAELWGTAAA